MSLHCTFLEGSIPYTGRELAPHWIAGRTGRFESSIVAFRGPCRVDTSELVDLEDRHARTFIEAAEMLHFLGEWFEGDLALAVARQRLLVAGFADLLRTRVPAGVVVLRKGNDLFVHRRKLSVSIVTASPVSTLFHFGVNLDPRGAPVEAIGLSELGLDPTSLAQETLRAWAEEWASMAKARCKVAPR